MEVLIDGVMYVPVQEKAEDEKVLAALDVRADFDCGDNITIRDYLFKLMQKLWFEDEGFNSKRPFGNSGWRWDLHDPLARYGFVEADIDKETLDCNFTDEQRKNADSFITEMIQAIFYGVEE